MIFVTKIFCKEQFKETYYWWSWKEEKFWIPLSNQKISLQKNLRKHSSEIHEVSLKCDICDHCFSQNGCLKIHKLPVHDENKTFKCELVITALLKRTVRLSSTQLQFTMLRNHSNVTFLTTVVLKMADWKYTCYQSMMKIKHPNSSSYKDSSTKHIVSVHNAKKSFKCDICDPSFYKKKHIVKVHESKKPFTCNLLM